MANKSIPDIQKDLKEICEYYTKLTSLLLINGYEDFLTNLKSLSQVECLESVATVLDAINEFIEEQQEEEEQVEEDDTIIRMLLAGIDDYPEVAAVAGAFQENLVNESQQNDTIGTIERQRFKKIMKTSLEKSLTEKIVPAIEAILEESLELPNRPKLTSIDVATPPALRKMLQHKGEIEFDNQKLRKMYQDTQKWREQTYNQSIRPKKWNAMSYRQQQQRKMYERDFLDESLPTPETSAKRNTQKIPAINVEGLNIEI